MIDNNMSPENIETTKEEFPTPTEIKPAINPALAAALGLLGVFFLYQIMGSLITLLVVGFDIENADINTLRIMTMSGQLLFILLPAILLSQLIYKNTSSVLRIKLPSLKETGVFILGFLILTPFLQELLYIQNYLFERLAENFIFIEKLKIILDEFNTVIDSTYASMLNATNIYEGFLVVLVVSIIPALCEEFFFRGFVQNSFEKSITPFWAILISSVVFGLYHLNPMSLFALIILGIYFGYAAYKSNSIFIPIILHFINNFLAVIAYFVYGDDDFTELESIKDMSFGEHAISLVLWISIFLVLFYYVNQNYHKLTKKESDHDLSEV